MTKHDVPLIRRTAILALAACTLPALLWGCAYFNTYYNAKTAFANARRDHQKFLKTRTDSTAAIPAAVISLYDRAIEKSAKVMEVYSRSVDWHDEAVFLMGRAQFYKGDYLAAIRRFKQLQREFPQSPHLPRSYLYLARAYLHNDNLADAEEMLQFVLDRFPELNSNEQVTLLMARIAIEREGKMQAIRLLEKTLATVKQPGQKLDIILKIANLSIELRRYEQAIELLKSAPRKKELSERLYLIDDALLRCYLKTGDYQRALSHAKRMRATKRYVAHLHEISLSYAIALKELGRIAEAVEELEALTNEDVDARLRGKAWLELALLYQHAIGDLEQALECYGNAISLLGDEQKRELARTRKAAIERIYALSDSVVAFKPDTADTIDRLNDMRYKIGETWWLRLDEPDSALDQFGRIVSDSAADSAAVMKALFARAWIYQSMKKDSAAADSLFHLVARRYPATEFAKKSQAALGGEVTLMTREDSAAAAFFKAEKLYVQDNNPLAASRAYLAVARTYQDLEIAAQSLYAAGWLCDNVLDKNVTARKIYMKLCDEYPRSSYCREEARPRLTVVSDTLNALRARKRKENGNSAASETAGGGSSGDEHEIEVESDAGPAMDADAAGE